MALWLYTPSDNAGRAWPLSEVLAAAPRTLHTRWPDSNILAGASRGDLMEIHREYPDLC